MLAGDTQAIVQPDGVVVAAPLPNDSFGLLQAVEDFSIQKLITQLAVEAFAVAILSGAAGLDVKRLGPNLG